MSLGSWGYTHYVPQKCSIVITVGTNENMLELITS